MVSHSLCSRSQINSSCDGRHLRMGKEPGQILHRFSLPWLSRICKMIKWLSRRKCPVVFLIIKTALISIQHHRVKNNRPVFGTLSIPLFQRMERVGKYQKYLACSQLWLFLSNTCTQASPSRISDISTCFCWCQFTKLLAYSSRSSWKISAGKEYVPIESVEYSSLSTGTLFPT